MDRGKGDETKKGFVVMFLMGEKFNFRKVYNYETCEIFFISCRAGADAVGIGYGGNVNL